MKLATFDGTSGFHSEMFSLLSRLVIPTVVS